MRKSCFACVITINKVLTENWKTIAMIAVGGAVLTSGYWDNQTVEMEHETEIVERISVSDLRQAWENQRAELKERI